MNREIKFRVWDGRQMLSHHEINESWFWAGKFGDWIVMQYTGLKDQNGKEIYEGDLMSCLQADVNKVIWYWDSWCYSNYHANALPLGELGNPYMNSGLLNCEIIGNIHENPELP